MHSVQISYPPLSADELCRLHVDPMPRRRNRTRALRRVLLDVPLVGALVRRFGSTSVLPEVAESFLVAAGCAAGGPAYDAATWYMHVRGALAHYPELVRPWPVLDAIDDFEGAGTCTHRWSEGDGSEANAPLQSLRLFEDDAGYCARCGWRFGAAPQVGPWARLCTRCARRLALFVEELAWFGPNPFRPAARAACVVCHTPMSFPSQAQTCGAACCQTVASVRELSAHILGRSAVRPDSVEDQYAALLGVAEPGSAASLGDGSADPTAALPSVASAEDPGPAPVLEVSELPSVASPALEVAAGEAPADPGPAPVLEGSELLALGGLPSDATAAAEPQSLSSAGWTLLVQAMVVHAINSAQTDRALEDCVCAVDREVALVRAQFERLCCQVVALSEAMDPSTHVSALLLPAAYDREVRLDPVGDGWVVFLPEASFSVSVTPLGARCDARLAHQVFPLWSVFVSACCRTERSVVAVELGAGSPLPRLVCVPADAGASVVPAPSSPIESFCAALEPVLERMAGCLQSRCRGGCALDGAVAPAG